MLALYRAGRQAEALEAYQDARHVLMESSGSSRARSCGRCSRRSFSRTLRSAQAARMSRPAARTAARSPCSSATSSIRRASRRELDPEVYRGLISRYFDVVREPIERHGGTVEKFIGDAVMAVFGVPELHEDDALRAVRAAREVQDALRDDRASKLASASAPAKCTCSRRRAKTCTSREQRRAWPHSSKDARPRAGSCSATRPIGSCATQCGQKPWRRLEARRGARGRAGVCAPARRAARRSRGGAAATADAYANAREDRHCRVVTVVGEAGIGKTRLAREFVASVRGEAQVLVGRCVSYGEGATYLPIAEIVRQAAAEPSLDGIRALLEGEEDADVVAQRVAELDRGRGVSRRSGRGVLGRAPAARVDRAQGAVVVALDDIHWAEPTLLDLVEYLGEWAEGPILVALSRSR